MSSAELQISSDSQLQADQEPEQDHNFRPGYSTLSLPKSSGHSDGHQRSFNHLTSSKYSTVSYRKIRRGNTRQKIDDFEYMITNLWEDLIQENENCRTRSITKKWALKEADRTSMPYGTQLTYLFVLKSTCRLMQLSRSSDTQDSSMESTLYMLCSIWLESNA